MLFSAYSGWKDIAIPHLKEEDIIAKKMKIATKYDNLRLQKYIFYPWHSYAKRIKERLRGKSLHSSNYFLYSCIQRIKKLISKQNLY